MNYSSKIATFIIFSFLILQPVYATEGTVSTDTTAVQAIETQQVKNETKKQVKSKNYDKKLAEINSLYKTANERRYDKGFDDNTAAFEKLSDKDIAKALKLTEQLIKENPGDDMLLAVKAKLLIAQKKYDEGKNLAFEALKLNPENYLANQRLSILYLENEEILNLKEALDYANKSITQNPKDADSYIARARIYHKLKDYDKAKVDFDTAAQLKPNDVRIYYNNFFLYRESGKFDLALSNIKKVIELKPYCLSAYYYEINAYMCLKDYKKALEKANELISKNPNYIDAYSIRALIYSDLNRTPEALSDINKAIKKKPNNFYYYDNRLGVYKNIKAADALVLSDLKKLESLSKNEYEYQKVVYWYFMFGKYNDCVRMSKKVLDINPKNIDVLFYNVLALEGLDQYDSLSHWLDIIEKTPNAIDSPIGKYNYYRLKAVNKLAKAGLTNKELIKDALNDINKQLEVSKGDASVYFMQGSSYLLLGRYKEAYYALKKSKELNYTIPVAYQLQFAKSMANEANSVYKNGKFVSWSIPKWLDDDEYGHTDFYAAILESDPNEIAARINMSAGMQSRQDIVSSIEKIKYKKTNLPIGKLVIDRTKYHSDWDVTNIEVSPYIDALGTVAKETTLANYNLILAYQYYKVIDRGFGNVYNLNDVYSQDIHNFYNQIENIPVNEAIDLVNQAIAKSGNAIYFGKNLDVAAYSLKRAISFIESKGLQYNSPKTKKIMKEANSLLGNIEYDKQNIDAAESFYEKAAKYGYSKFDAYKKFVFYYYDKKDYFNVIRYATKALSAKGDIDMFYIRGLAKYRTNDYSGAIYDATKAIGYNSKYKDAYWLRASIFFDQKRYDQAFNDYQIYSKLDASDAAAYYNMGVCLYNQKKRMAAVPYLEKAKSKYQANGDRSGYNKSINLINEIKGYSRW